MGAEGIPFYYVLFGIVSIPFAAFFSAIIDRFPRPVLFNNMLGAFTVTTIVLAYVLMLGDVWCYVAFLAVRIVEHMILSVYYILFSDYFTVTDTKRYAGRVALGMAVGGLAGGALLTAVTGFGGPIVAAAATPALVAAALVFGAWLTRREHPLDAGVPASREGVIESLRILPRLLRRYPLIALLSAAMFLNVLLQCVAEFLAFSIYTIHFPAVEDLAVFLGLVNAGLNVLGFLIIVLFTDRQLPRLRVFIDGMIFPAGLAAAGLLLMTFQGRLELRAIAAFGLALSLVLFVLHWNIGKEYVRGLIEMLRDGAVELDAVASGLRVPPEHVEEIRAMLAGDSRTALMGLQMAARCEGEIPAAEIATALAKIPMAQAREVLAQFAASSKPASRAMLEALAETAPPEVRQLACERIFCSADPAMADRAAQLLDCPDHGVRCVAAARMLIHNPEDNAARELLRGGLPAEAALGAIEVLRQAGGPVLLPILATIGEHADPAVRAAALAAAGAHAADDPVV